MKDARKAELDALAADLEPVQTELDASNAAYQGALAEGRLLREALLEWKFITQSMAGPDLIDAMEQGYEALNATPLTAAEVERVKRLEKVAEAAPTIDHLDQLIEFMDSADRMMEALGNPDNADINVGALAEKIGVTGYKAADEHQVQDDLLTFRVALAALEEGEG